MDSTAQYPAIVRQILQQYAQFKPSHGDIRLDTVFDDRQNRYALMQVGWDRGRRIRGNIVYVTIRDSKVWIEYDGMERSVTEAFVAAGIPAEAIVLAFLEEPQAAAL